MGDKITRNLKKYQRAVLAGMDAMGCPFSVRCVPEMDANAQVLRVQLPPGCSCNLVQRARSATSTTSCSGTWKASSCEAT